METRTISAELTEEQYKKYEILNENDVSIGEAIDLLFELRDNYNVTIDQILEDRVAELEDKKKNLSKEIDSIDDELGILSKLSDGALDPQQKQVIIEKEIDSFSGSYEMEVQAKKHKITWAKDFFKF